METWLIVLQIIVFIISVFGFVYGIAPSLKESQKTRKLKQAIEEKKPIKLKVRQTDGTSVNINYTPGDIHSADELLTALKK